MNKEVLDAYRKIVTRELEARNLRLTGSLFAGGNITAEGNLVITGSISGSSYLGVSASAGVSSVAASGSGDLTSRVYFTGSGDNVVTQSGQVITISGSPDLISVTGIAASGSSSLTGNVYFTGSGGTVATQSGQAITISGSEQGVSSLAASGSTLLTREVYITGSTPNLTATQNGQVVQFTLNSSLTGLNSITATNVTGSSILSGSNIYGQNAVATNVTATNITGSSLLSGSDIRGFTATIASIASTNITATNVTGSSSISGSNIYGNSAVITSVTSTNITGSTISGSTYIGDVVKSVANSGSAGLNDRVYLTGSGTISVTQNGQVIDISGSQAAAGVSGIAKSGSTFLINNIYFTGSSNIDLTQTDQALNYGLSPNIVLTSVTATNVTGSAIVSGSAIYGADAVITNVTSTNITGSTISGSYLGSSAIITNVTSTNITGSTLISGSSIAGQTATIAYVNATNVTGSSLISGSSIYGATAVITNVTSTNVTGSNSISGSSVFGKDAVITNVTSTYVTGSTFVSGSTLAGATANIVNVNATYVTGSALLSGSDIRSPTATITNIVATNVTGSSILSGSNILGNSAILTYVTSTSITGSTVSGSTYQGNLVTSVNNSGSGNLVGAVTFTGSGTVSVSESGQIITISGSQTEGAVTGLANSGSSLLTGVIYLTGSQTVKITQSGQSITISGSSDAITLEGLTANQVRTHTPASHGSSHTSGSGDAVTIYKNQISDLRTEQFNIPSFTATGSGTSGISGSLTIVGTISGSTYEGITTTVHASTHVTGSTDPLTGNFFFTNLTATNITGSTLVSGSEFRGPLSTIVNIIATNITGSSILSGANIYGPAATITSLISTNVTATNITGSGLLSGSVIRGPIAYITDVVATNVTGSTLSGSNIYGPAANITNAYVTNVTGSGTLSGSIVRGSVISGSGLGIVGNAVVTGNLSGSTISGSITMNMDGNARVGVRQNSGGTSYIRRRINFIEGSNTSFTIGDDAVSEEVDVTIASNTGSGELPASYVIWSGSTAYYAQNGHTGVITSNASAHTILQNTINALSGSGVYGGKLFIKDGFYAITGSDLIFPDGGSYYLEGEKSIHYEQDNYGGAVLSFQGARLIATGSSPTSANRLLLRNIALNFEGIYTSRPVFETNWHVLRLYDVVIKCQALLTNGETFARFGYGGASSLSYIFDEVMFIDQRTSGSVDGAYGYESMFMYLWPESLVMRGCTFYADHNIDKANIFRLQVASWSKIENFTFYTTSTFVSNGKKYDTQFIGYRNLVLENVQFLDPSYLGGGSRNAHIAQYDEDLYVTILNPVLQEAGNTPILPVTTGSCYIKYIGRGFEKQGYASVANGGTITHGLVTIPTTVSLIASGSTPANFSYTADATNVTVYHNAGGNLGIFWRAEI